MLSDGRTETGIQGRDLAPMMSQTDILRLIAVQKSYKRMLGVSLKSHPAALEPK